MRRALFYDAHCRAATTIAAVLAGRFDVHALPRDPTAVKTPAVVLVGLTSDSRCPPTMRAIGLAGPGDGRWPEGWFLVLPEDAPAPIVAAAVERAFADLEASDELRRLGSELAELNAIGVRLSAERNPDVLLELILTKARGITQSDAGSLYLVEEAPDGGRQLRFVLAQNDSIKIDFRSATLPLTTESVAGYVTLTGATVNVDDAYRPPPGSPFRMNRAFDDAAGYRTKSMLVVPMRTLQGESIGALQLINCKADFHRPFRSTAEIESQAQRFSARHESLAGSLASQAAVALDASRLYQSIRRLFEGFVKASVIAIESRDPSTSGHSFRVAELTLGLAAAVERCRRGRYAHTRFTPDDLMELRYAALLHDFGKVGVREHILVKAKKLYEPELERIRQRGALIKRGLELRAAERKLAFLLGTGAAGYAELAAVLDAELVATLAEVDAGLADIERANEPTILPQDVADRVHRLTERRFDDGDSGLALLTEEEAAALSIPRGSLTTDENRQIQSHVLHTVQFLSEIPWTKEFRRVPEIAAAHHERLDGSGYPKGLMGEDIPLQSRIISIADVYDALTAADRPYKKAVPVERALDILDSECRAGLVDGDLLRLFVDERVWERTPTI